MCSIDSYKKTTKNFGSALSKLQSDFPPFWWDIFMWMIPVLNKQFLFLNLFPIPLLSHLLRNDSSLGYPHLINSKPFPLILCFICPFFGSLVSTHHIWHFKHHVRFTQQQPPSLAASHPVLCSPSIYHTIQFIQNCLDYIFAPAHCLR